MIITISGNPGSGKSSIAKILVEKLKAERIYAGGMKREMAKEKGLKLEEFLRLAEKDPTFDKEIDSQVRDKARTLDKSGKKVVVEGRVHFHFLPESVKIYVKVDEKEGARRIWKDLQSKEASQQRNQDAANSVEEVLKKNRAREKEDVKQFLDIYGVNYLDLKNYDLVIDSTKITPEQAAEKIITFIKKQKEV